MGGDVAGLRALLDGVAADEERNRRSLNLTANESVMSDTARSFLSYGLGDRYFSGAGDENGVVTNPFTPFTTRGLPGLARLVDAATGAAGKLLGATGVNLSCLSGVHAMICAILATTEPGARVAILGVGAGGHFGTRGILERTGRQPVDLPVDETSGRIDRPALGMLGDDLDAVYLNASFYLRPWDLAAIRAAVGKDVRIIYDASHTLGLIMGGLFQSPLDEGADVLCGNTHKTFPGPQKGLIAFRDPAVADASNAIMEDGLYSSRNSMATAALAVTILEMAEFGPDYAAAVIENANALAAALARRGGELRGTGGGAHTANHQVHLFTDRVDHHYELYRRLDRNDIAVNFDNALGGRTYVRFGVQEVTRRGMGPAEMEIVAEAVRRSFEGQVIKDEVGGLVRRFPGVRFSFDAAIAGSHRGDVTR